MLDNLESAQQRDGQLQPNAVTAALVAAFSDLEEQLADAAIRIDDAVKAQLQKRAAAVRLTQGEYVRKLVEADLRTHQGGKK